MINKQNLWFLTLFSLILVLSVYYITMPDNLLNNLEVNTPTKEVSINIRESEVLTALRVADDEEILKEMDNLQKILLDESTPAEEKSNAYDSLKELNLNKGKEQMLEQKVMERHNLKCYIKIKNDQIKVVATSDKHDAELANKIIRTIQEHFKDQMYITVKFQP